MKTAYVRVDDQHRGVRSAPVRGVAVGPFVVHRTPKAFRTPDEWWRVTHKQSGLLAAWDMTKAGAIKKARAILASAKKYRVDWSAIKTYEDAKAQISQSAREEFKRVGGWY